MRFVNVKGMDWKMIKKSLIMGLKACKTRKQLEAYLETLSEAYVAVATKER